jgi:hypothetical protein
VILKGGHRESLQVNCLGGLGRTRYR